MYMLCSAFCADPAGRVPDDHVDDEPNERTRATRKQRTSDDEVSITREAALLPLYLVHRVLELAMLQRVDIVSVVPSDRQEEVNIPGIGPGGGAGHKRAVDVRSQGTVG
jgi:hypothetical protein